MTKPCRGPTTPALACASRILHHRKLTNNGQNNTISNTFPAPFNGIKGRLLILAHDIMYVGKLNLNISNVYMIKT